MESELSQRLTDAARGLTPLSPTCVVRTRESGIFLFRRWIIPHIRVERTQWVKRSIFGLWNSPLLTQGRLTDGRTRSSRWPNAIEAFIVGQLRELRADEDNDSLRLHDGVKEGGYEFLNRDQSDARYQAASPELDGFKFGAQEKGILTRVGPASYKVRKVQSTTADLTITNPSGTAGDFDLNLTPDH
jgi:hypothetical protein